MMDGNPGWMVTGNDNDNEPDPNHSLEISTTQQSSPSPFRWPSSDSIDPLLTCSSFNPHSGFTPTEPTHGLDDFGQRPMGDQYHQTWASSQDMVSLPTVPMLMTVPIPMVETTFGEQFEPMTVLPATPSTTSEPISQHLPRTAKTKEGPAGRDAWTPEQDEFLLRCWKEGWKYAKIAQEMKVKFPGLANTNENRLVKRLHKIQGRYLDPLPKAVKQAMPRIMACIEDEMKGMPELDDILDVDKELHSQIMKDLPHSIPKFVQIKVTSKRKTWRSVSPTRDGSGEMDIEE